MYIIKKWNQLGSKNQYHLIWHLLYSFTVPRIINDIYIIFYIIIYIIFFNLMMFARCLWNTAQTALFYLYLYFNLLVIFFSQNAFWLKYRYILQVTPSYIDITTLAFNPWRNSQFLFSSGSLSVYIRFAWPPSWNWWYSSPEGMNRIFTSVWR